MFYYYKTPENVGQHGLIGTEKNRYGVDEYVYLVSEQEMRHRAYRHHQRPNMKWERGSFAWYVSLQEATPIKTIKKLQNILTK